MLILTHDNTLCSYQTIMTMFHDLLPFIRSMGGTEKTKLYAEEDIAKLAVLKSNDTVAKK